MMRAYVRRLLLLGVILGAWAPSAQAQLLGYGIGGPAGYEGFFGSGSGLHLAGGGEVLVKGIAGVGAEVGVLGSGGSALWVKSVNGVLHVPAGTGTRRLSAFVTAGYTSMSSGEGSFDAWNVGGGLDVWPKDRVGVRVEFRDHLRPDSRGRVHYWSLRAGVVVR
jgi:hypothetical protein